MALPASAAAGQPLLADPTAFSIELFADMQELGPETQVLHLTLTPGHNGFDTGLYVTSPFSLGEDSIIHVDGDGHTQILASRFNAPETLLFAQGPFGDGMLIAEAGETRIVRLMPDGTRTTFADLGTAPFGPTVMLYAQDDEIRVTDFSGSQILSVSPDGGSDLFAEVPEPVTGPAPPGSFIVAGSKGQFLDATVTAAYGGDTIYGTFSVVTGPEQQLIDADVLYFVSPDGSEVTEFVGGFNGFEMFSFGPGGAFSEHLYVAEMGSNVINDGAVSIVSPDGEVRPFLTGIDATHVVFDTAGILGGGMFVGEFGNFDSDLGHRRAGRIWRVTAEPFLPTGDMNFDGVVDTADVAPFVQALTNSEGYMARFGVDEDTMITLGDINNDGSFDTADVAPFVQVLVGGSQSVPEPGTVLLLAVGAMLLLRRVT